MKKKKKEKRVADKAKTVSVFEKVMRGLYRLVRDGAVGEYLSGYDKTCERYKNTWFYHKWEWLEKKLLWKEKEKIQQEKKPDGMENIGIYKEETLPSSFRDRFSSTFDSSMVGMILKVL